MYLDESERPSKAQKVDSSSDSDSEEQVSDVASVAGSTKSVVDPEEELRAFKDVEPLSKDWKNRQRVLMVCQRGIEGKFRHLMDDLINLIPHSKKEAKVEKK